MFKHRLHPNSLLLLLVVLLTVACSKKKTDFNYSPAQPRAGQSILFSNTSDDAEEWLWTFGDGNTSASKSPSKIYRKPGTYTVILKADNKNSRTCSKTITILDTVPRITISDTVYRYYSPLQFSVSVYNPYGYSLEYEWNFPEGTIFLAGDSICTEPNLTQAKQVVCMTGKNQRQTVHLTLKQGEQIYDIDTTIYVQDMPAPALVMVTAMEEQLVRQRLYTYGVESASAMPKSELNGIRSIAARGDVLYLFSTMAPYGIHAYSLTKGTSETVITGSSAFHSGTLLGVGAAQRLYWTDGSQNAYSAPASTRNATCSNEYLLQSVSKLGLSAEAIGNITLYNGNYLWAIEEEGICYYTQDWKPISSILSMYDISQFAIDPLAKKVYFIADEQLFVSNLDGSFVESLSDGVTNGGLYVDNQNNRVFYSHMSGVRTMPLVQTRNNYTTKRYAQINDLQVQALTIDNTER